MDDALPSTLAEQLDELQRERARLAETLRAYRVVRASRFSRMRDFVLAAKRLIAPPHEAPAFAFLELPQPHPSLWDRLR